MKQQIQFQQLFQGREWWDNLNAPKNFHVTKDFLKMLNFFKHKSGYCWYRNFDNCVYLEECILCKTVKAFFFLQRNIICVASSRLTKWEGVSSIPDTWHFMTVVTSAVVLRLTGLYLIYRDRCLCSVVYVFLNVSLQSNNYLHNKAPSAETN